MTYKISVIVPAYNEEKYLNNALNSLVEQTYAGFEVIIINDGSTDETQKIIDKYCKNYSNFRGIYQENSGVSAARNRGIKESKGDYIAFLDADDQYVDNALEKLYEMALMYGADLVVGRMQIINAFDSVIYTGPVNLSKMRNIDPFDKELIWTGSMCNKLFSKKKLIESRVTVPKLKYDEDSAFIMDFALKCEKIVGCPHNIVLYHKRPFWEGFSVTQAVNIEYIEDFLAAYDIIGKMVEQAFKEKMDSANDLKIKKELSQKYRKYLDELCHRRIAILCNEFYRFFWKADVKSLELINKSLNEVKKDMSVESWDMDVEKFHELRIENLIYDKKEMSENPLVTIVIHYDEIEPDELNFLLDSMYSQTFPAFEIIVPYNLSEMISDSILKNENLKLLKTDKNFKNESLKIAKGNNIIFVEDMVFFEPETIRFMYNYLQNPEFDFVALKIYQLKTNKLVGFVHQELAYSYRNTKEDNVKSLFNYLDLYLSNKLINTDYLRDKKFKFSNDPAKDVLKLYTTAKFKKLRNKYILSNKDEKILLKSLKSHDKSITNKLNYLILTKNSVHRFLKLRRFISKET